MSSFVTHFVHFLQSFNRELDTLKSSQQEYSIADIEQAKLLRQAIAANMVPAYSDYFHRYSKTSFTRNHDKYLKYTPQDLSETIDTMFDVIATD
jgi:exocyst complex protein 7